ncbi:MAG: hypothetical protein Q9208_004622 [Pyrenodesmia sp. 3 TL-2023]
MTDNATFILWMHEGRSMDAIRPDLAMITGFARPLVLEQPSLRFFTHGIANVDVNTEATITNVLPISTLFTMRAAFRPGGGGEAQPSIYPTLHTEEFLNTNFRQKLGNRAATKAFARVATELNPDHVEIDVKSVSLNAKDGFMYSGRVDTRGTTSSLECTSLVSKGRSHVSPFKAGDRVVCMAPGHFSSLESFPEWACAKLKDDENLQSGEPVLIHFGAGGVGIAAIQIANLRGATVYSTVSTEEKKDFLVENFGVKRENIFNSNDSSFLPAIMAATDGKGVDVVLNSLVGDLLHDSWRCCARFGRFVEIGKRDVTDAGKLDMQIFKRNVTFTAFDVSELCDENDGAVSTVWARLLKDIISLYRDGKIKSFDPLKIFPTSEISDAFRYF